MTLNKKMATQINELISDILHKYDTKSRKKSKKRRMSISVV